MCRGIVDALLISADMLTYFTTQALVTCFYPGQPEADFMLSCKETVAEADARGAEGAGESAIAAGAAASAVLARML